MSSTSKTVKTIVVYRFMSSESLIALKDIEDWENSPNAKWLSKHGTFYYTRELIHEPIWQYTVLIDLKDAIITMYALMDYFEYA